MGRPRIEVDIDQLAKLVTTNLTTSEIADKLGCSFDVVRSRMREHKLSRKRDPMKVCRFGGHDLTVPGSKSANGQCLACKRESAARRRKEPPSFDLEPRLDAMGRRHKGVHVYIDLARVVMLRNRGMNLRQIAKELGVTYGTLTKRTAKAGISFTVGMTPERWQARREKLSEGATLRPRDSDVEQARQASLQAEYLAAVVEEESLPHWQRGRAAQLRAAMESTKG